jgi:hypothetical protein
VTAVQPLVVDAAVAEHLEILGVAAIGLVYAVEGVAHARPFDRLLIDTVDDGRLRQAGGLEHGGGDVNDVVELRSHLATRREPTWPMHDRAVARAAPV